MKLHLDLIKDGPSLKRVAEKIQNCSILAFDTEFIREKTFHPELALIQLATEEDAWLVDAPALTRQEITPLLNLLEDPKILKVLHSAFGDQECLWSAYRITAKPVLDTFEAAALCGYGESVSLGDLVNRVLRVKLPKMHSRTHWLRRPLSEEMRSYALSDVQYLIPLLTTLQKELSDLERWEWALELSETTSDPLLYEPNVQALATRLAQGGRFTPETFGVLCALVEWRENRARSINIPRKRIADDGTLISLAQSRPHTLDKLAQFRGLNPGELQRQGAALLKIMENPVASTHLPVFSAPKVFRPSSAQSRAIDYLSTFLKAICQEKRIASRLIMTVKDLTEIVVDQLQAPQEWIERKLCSPRACSLVAEELSAALMGRKGLALQKGKLTLLELTEVQHETL